MAYELLFPFVFEWIHRKIHARVQMRVGPPFFQPLYDFIKLLRKKVILPEQKSFLFCLMPFLLFLVNCVAVIVAYRQIQYAVLILLVLFSLDVLFKVFLANSAKSPFTIQGLARLGSMKMALDPAFPLSFLAPAFIFGWNMTWPIMAAIFFPIAFIASLAELELSPFNIPNARTEIAGGWKAELSGVLLGLVNFAEDAKIVAMSLLLASFFGSQFLILKAILVFSLMSLISAALPRFTVEKAVKYLTILNIVAMAEVILSLSLVP